MLEWSEFARRLGRELAGLERDTILIVREREESRHYVQAMREPDRLYAEAVSNNFLEGPLLLTLADEEVMSEAGWRPPADPAPRNWWTELPEFGTPGGMQSVTEADFARLADVMVTALRDVQGVRRPSDLVYESFHRHGTGLIELPDFGIEVADPSRVNERRSSSGETSGPIPAVAGGPAPGGGPLPAGTPPGEPPVPPHQVPPAAPADPDLLELRLAEAKANGDSGTYFRLLADADLVLPATAPAVEDPDRAELPTIVIGSDTYVTVFTSPAALARTGDRHPGLYRRTTFGELAAAWPDPAWRLAINWGLPSEVLLDSSVVPRLHGGTDTAPPPVQDAPNPYGKVDPNALAGPNPVVGGPVLSANGALPSPHDEGPAREDDDSHTAVDPFTAADLQAALDAGGPGKPAPAEAAPAADPEPEPPAMEPPAMEASAPESPAPQRIAEPEPAEPDPLRPESLRPDPLRPDPLQPEPLRPDPVRQEPVRPDHVRQEPVQQEPVQSEQARPEPVPTDAPAESPQPDPLQPGTAQPEHGRPGPLRADTVQSERPQSEQVRPERVQPEQSRSERVQQPPGIPIRPPHGTRLWRWTGEGEETPLAVYDAVGGVWAPVRADAVQAPRTE